MKKKWKIIIAVVSLAIIFGAVGFNYVIHGGARDIQSEESVFKVGAKEFVNEFTSNSEQATKKYLNKTIEISGQITNVKDSVVTVNDIVVCKMISLDKVKNNETTTLKGRVVGFDDLLGEIQLDECNIKQ